MGEDVPSRTVVVVESRPVAQLGLLRLLRSAGAKGVLTCRSLSEFPARPASPVVLVGLSCWADGMRAEVQRLRGTAPGLRFVGVGTGEGTPCEGVFGALPHLDAVVMHPSPEAVRAAIRSVLGGRHYFEGTVPERVWRRMSPATGSGCLSPVERRVLELLGDGLTDAEVAERLGCSVAKAKACVRAVLRKTGSRNRAHAVAKALREGWIE